MAKEERIDLTPVHFEGFGKPEDGRLKGYHGKVTHPTLPLERSYCSHCGAPYGWVSEESSQLIAAAEVIVFCQQCEHDMNTKLGPVPLKAAGDQNTTDIPPNPKKQGIII